MSHFAALTATEFPQDLKAVFKKEMPDSSVVDFVARKMKQVSGHEEGQKVLAQPPQITDQDRIELLAFHLSGKRLEPYWKKTENPAHLAFYCASEISRKVYETKRIDCVRMPDGRIISCHHPDFYRLYEMDHGKVYKREYGPLHSPEHTANAEEILPLPDYPLKKLYPSYGCFMECYYGCTFDAETGKYGIYQNPNAQWDWFEIGGRWPLRFLVMEDCPLVVCGRPSSLFENPPQREAPKGYRWVAGARKCDIAWDLMRKDAQARHTKNYNRYETWFQKGEIPKEGMRSFTLQKDGIMSLGDYVYRKGETLETYLDRMGVSDQYRYPLTTFACVDGNGWSSQDDMGFFGIGSDSKDKRIWNKVVDDFIAEQPDETVLISVDCHF